MRIGSQSAKSGKLFTSESPTILSVCSKSNCKGCTGEGTMPLPPHNLNNFGGTYEGEKLSSIHEGIVSATGMHQSP